MTLRISFLVAIVAAGLVPSTTKAQPGIPLWTNAYSWASNTINDPSSIAVDGSGNLYVTGWSGSSWDYDIATIKFSSSGLALWRKSLLCYSNVE